MMAVPSIPRTLSGKKLEVPVKRILTGTPPEAAASRGSLANPESLDAFLALRETVRVSVAQSPKDVSPRA
jgi:acetoacetyl-CoA synthetase